jgi:hypothetical protein
MGYSQPPMPVVANPAIRYICHSTTTRCDVHQIVDRMWGSGALALTQGVPRKRLS